MKKLLVLFAVLVIVVGFLPDLGKVEAQSPIDVNEANYRVPVIGSGFDITRFECPDPLTGEPHRPYGNEAGRRFMDINVHGAGEGDEGTPIYSSSGGTVRETNEDEGLVRIDDNQVGFRYAHMAKIYVVSGQSVYKGQLLGYMGREGENGNTSHLHWEIYPLPGYSIDPMEIQGVEENLPGGACDSGPIDGTMWGDSIFSWDSCSAFYNAAMAAGYQYVVLFDHKDCRGNALVIPWLGYGGWDLTNRFNDRTRSIFIPPGKSVIVSAHADNPASLYLCHSVDMWNLDVDSYDNNPNVRLGWQGAPGYNMVSYVTVRSDSTCPSNAQGAILAAPLGGGATVINTHVDFQTVSVTPQPPQYGDSHVDIREDINFASGQYGWDNPTNGWVNVPDYMNDRTSSIAIDSGYSIKVAKDQNGGGANKCLVTSYSDLSGAYYDDGSPMTDTISSVWVYSDSTCGGTYIGTEPGDTVTVWVDPNYWGTHYGWHDPFTGNVEGYVSNGITAIAVTPGWSAVVYEGGGLSGGFACFTGSDPDLTNNLMNNSVPVNDTVESIEVFHDSVCGGRMHAPTASLVSTVTNASIKEVTNHLVWSGAAPTWQHFDFGDGATYDVSGASGDVSPTHQYVNYGTYTVTVTVYGTDGIGYPYTQQVAIPAPQPPTVSLSVMHGSGSDFNYVEVDADWSGAAEDWQIVTFGDGGEVGYFGSSGTSVGHPNGNVHWYACCGDYAIAFNVRGADGQLYTDTEVVSVQLPSSPSVTLSAVVTNPTTGLVETNATWSGASENWQVLNWGDGTETGYFGGSGTNVGHPNGHTHVYLPGSYTLTFTVLDFFGQPHTLTQNVTINAPTAPTLSVAFTQGTGETFNYVEVQATWSSAAGDWQVVDFGDGSSVGYFGGNGTSVGHPHGNSHWYAVGNYTITFTVKGLDGQSYTATVPVSITAP